MGSIVTKFQKCGKNNCKKCREGSGHGPYKWRVTYISAKSQIIDESGIKRKGRYKWEYLGKAD